MENRYLPGMLYWKGAGQSVWRMYDQLLEIKVFAFWAKEGQQEQLYQMARKLERLNLLDEHFVKILAVKKINEEWFLLFSEKDAEEKKQQIQAVLAAKDLQETEEMPDFSQYREQGRKKEQVLPCGTILNGQYQVLDCVSDKYALLAASPLTGRTHQIRAHLEFIGTPILGDGKYFGTDREKSGMFVHKLHLHAYKIDLSSVYGRKLIVQAKLPGYFKDSLSTLGLNFRG